MVEPDQIKTNIRTKWATFVFRRMPFGLINARVTFQITLDIAFQGLMGQSVVFYLNDFTILSKKRANHLHHLKHIFDWCWKYEISLNPKKSIFTVFEGNLPGHIITKYGITINPSHIKAITQIPQLSKKMVCNLSLVKSILFAILFHILRKL